MRRTCGRPHRYPQALIHKASSSLVLGTSPASRNQPTTPSADLAQEDRNRGNNVGEGFNNACVIQGSLLFQYPEWILPLTWTVAELTAQSALPAGTTRTGPRPPFE